MTSQDIDNLLQYGEHLSMECKKAEKGLPKSVWESYSAFANTKGGLILLGIQENLEEQDWQKRFVVTGVANVRQQKKAFWDTVSNRSKVSAKVFPPEATDFLRLQFKNQYDLLNASEQLILVTAFLEKSVSNEKLQPFLETLHPVEIGKTLAKLVEKGFLKRQGNGRGAVYCLDGSQLQQLSLPFDTTVQDASTQDASVQDASVQDASVQDASVQDAGTQDAGTQDRKIQYVLELLGNDALSCAELLQKSGKKERASFYKRYLKPALEAGAIEMTHPDKPNRRNQRYRKKSMEQRKANS